MLKRVLLLFPLILLLTASSYGQRAKTVSKDHALRLWGVVEASNSTLEINPDNRWPLGYFALGYGWQRTTDARTVLHDLTLQRLAFRQDASRSQEINEMDLELSYDQSRMISGDHKLALYGGLGATVYFATNNVVPTTSAGFPREERQWGGSLFGLIRLQAQLTDHLYADVKTYPLAFRSSNTRTYVDNPILSMPQRTVNTSDFELFFFQRMLIGLGYQF